MKYLRTLLAATLFFNASLAVSDEVVIDTPMAAATLELTDRHASIFYLEGKESYKVILAFSTGHEENEQLIRQSLQLKDGQSHKVSIGGYGLNEQASTISITRKDDKIVAGIVTCDTRETMANCI